VTGASPATISRAVTRLCREGLAVEEDAPVARVGRPPRLVRLRPDAAYVVGVDAGAAGMRAVLTDLEGSVRARETSVVSPSHRVEEFADAMADLVSRVADGVQNRVVAVGAGISGIVDAAKGRVLLSPDLPVLNGEQVAALLSEAIALPVAIDNDDLLAAAGEVSYGAARGCADVAFLSLGYGVGAGLMVGGRPVHGARSSAGAIAYFAPDGLERRASGRSIPLRYVERGGVDDDVSAERVFELADDDDPAAVAVVAEAVEALGDLVVNVAAMLDPEVIVLGGGLVRGQPGLRDQLGSRLVEALPFPPRLVVSALGEDAVARGAASLALVRARRLLAGVPEQAPRLRALESV
jgi:predicted NBD/HSP70 family sugar kinase